MNISDPNSIFEQAKQITREYQTMQKYSINPEMAGEMIEIRLVDYLNILESQGRALKAIEQSHALITDLLTILGEVVK